MNNQILTKFTDMLKIHSNQSINYLLTEEKKQESKNRKSKNIHLLFTNIDNNPTKKRKVFGDMITDMESK